MTAAAPETGLAAALDGVGARDGGADGAAEYAAALDGVGARDGGADGAAEYAAAIAALRALWLTERRPDETVAAWLVRTGRRKGVLA